MGPKPVPTVSVIVPNYNHARFLEQRIESILRQTYQDFELILLDDCSTDESCAVLSKYTGDPRVRLEFNDTNSGSTFKQWNKGVGLAAGKYVWIAESDDYADERFLEKLAPRLDADASVAFAYCRSWRISEDGQKRGFADHYLDYLDPHHWASDFRVEGSEEVRNYFVFLNTVPNASAVVFRRAAYESAGGADETFRLCGDWKLWVTMALGGRIAYLAEPLNYFRSHDASVRHKAAREAVGSAETIRTVRWILAQVTPEARVLERVRRQHVSCWVPVVMSLHVPLETKRAAWRDIQLIDPHPLRRVVRPALLTLGLKIARHWRALRATNSHAAE